MPTAALTIGARSATRCYVATISVSRPPTEMSDSEVRSKVERQQHYARFHHRGTGLIGRHLVRRLVERGDQPVILSRRADKVRRDPRMRGIEVVQGDPTARRLGSAVDGCDAVVNLAGHNIFAERWNAEVKRKIRDSRVYGTENVVAAIAQGEAAARRCWSRPRRSAITARTATRS